MVYNMTMKKVNIADAKARLSEYLEAVERGESIVICRRNRAVAELRPIAAQRTTPRPLGGAAGRLTVPAIFFEPLPDEVLDAFGLAAVGPVRRPLVAARPRSQSRSRRQPRR
jgi:prevent-host-death family protein